MDSLYSVSDYINKVRHSPRAVEGRTSPLVDRISRIQYGLQGMFAMCYSTGEHVFSITVDAYSNASAIAICTTLFILPTLDRRAP